MVRNERQDPKEYSGQKSPNIRGYIGLVQETLWLYKDHVDIQNGYQRISANIANRRNSGLNPLTALAKNPIDESKIGELVKTVDDALSHLLEEHQKALSSRFSLSEPGGYLKTYKEVGRELGGISEQNAGRKVKNALRKLFYSGEIEAVIKNPG